MKTKFIVMAAMAALFSMGFTACSNNDDELANQQIAEARGISFDVHANNSVVTRGYATNATNALETITAFQTWGYDDVTRGLYMGNSASEGRTVSNTGTALAPIWSYTPVQFWPVNPLNFVAVAPATDASYGAFTTSATANEAPATDSYVTASVPVTLSLNVEDQKDIMFAKADGITKATSTANVPFTFEHALSQVVFKGKFSNTGAVTKVTIAEIALVNVNKAGTLVYTSEGTWYGGATYPAVSGTPATFSLDNGDLEGYIFDVADDVDGETEGVQARGVEPFDLTVSNNSTKKNAWMLIPQVLDGGAAIVKPGDTAPSDGKAYLKVRAQLEKDGVVILGSAEADAIYIPIDQTWERSKRYIYTIEFNGESALTPITFSVAAEPWTDASGIDVEM